MKLLFDEQLSPKLVQRTDDLFPGSAHVHDLGLGESDDRELWQYAADHGFTIVTKDADFAELSSVRVLRPGSCGCAYPTVRHDRSPTCCARNQKQSRTWRTIRPPRS